MQSDGKYYWCPPPLAGEDLSGVPYGEIVARADRESDGPWWDTEEAFRYRVFQLRGALEYHLDKRELLPSDDYLEVAYEDLCDSPKQVLARLFEFIGVRGLADPTEAQGYFTSRNYKYGELPSHLRRFADEELRDIALRLGYG